MATIKDKFKWAIPLTSQEIDDIWKKAILTVDTNVLYAISSFRMVSI